MKKIKNIKYESPHFELTHDKTREIIVLSVSNRDPA
jgi:hypothetical protein